MTTAPASGLTAGLVPRPASADEALRVARSCADSIAAGVIEPNRAGQVPQAHFLFTDVLAVWGTPAQQQRLFAGVLAGGRLGNGLAERGGLHAQDAAAAALDEVTRTPRDAAAAARGSIAVAQAKAFGSEVAGEVASELFALSGASAADEKYGLSRHWRNTGTQASHDPADWKYQHAGNYLLNSVAPPNHGQI